MARSARRPPSWAAPGRISSALRRCARTCPSPSRPSGQKGRRRSDGFERGRGRRSGEGCVGRLVGRGLNECFGFLIAVSSHLKKVVSSLSLKSPCSMALSLLSFSLFLLLSPFFFLSFTLSFLSLLVHFSLSLLLSFSHSLFRSSYLFSPTSSFCHFLSFSLSLSTLKCTAIVNASGRAAPLSVEVVFPF